MRFVSAHFSQVCIYNKALQLSIGTGEGGAGGAVKGGDSSQEGGAEEEQPQHSNIDLGGILNLATEDTLNIR